MKIHLNRKKAVGISFPKSGRTWLRKMLMDLGIALPFNHAGSNAYEYGVIPGTPILNSFKESSILFLMRDPRDVLMSYHKDLTQRHRVSSDCIFDFAKMPGIGIDGIIDFNLACLEHSKQNDRTLLVTYERLCSDCESELDRIFWFLGTFWITKKRVRRVIEDSSFETMRNNERNGKFNGVYPPHWFEGHDPNRPPKVRRGKPGGYLDEMPEKVREFCNSRLRLRGYPRELLAYGFD